MILQPIVEGHGEEQAVPVLVRRILQAANCYQLQVARPHRRHRTELVKRDRLQVAVQFAARQKDCIGILVIFDADGDCPKELVTQLQGWCREVSAGKPCEVVIAKQEYEAWFLAGIEGLRGKRSILNNASFTSDPEGPRGAKAHLERLMAPESTYLETADQAPFSAEMDLAAAYRRCRSFRRLVNSLDRVMRTNGLVSADWIPESWRREPAA